MADPEQGALRRRRPSANTCGGTIYVGASADRGPMKGVDTRRSRRAAAQERGRAQRHATSGSDRRRNAQPGRADPSAHADPQRAREALRSRPEHVSMSARKARRPEAAARRVGPPRAARTRCRLAVVPEWFCVMTRRTPWGQTARVATATHLRRPETRGSSGGALDGVHAPSAQGTHEEVEESEQTAIQRMQADEAMDL